MTEPMQPNTPWNPTRLRFWSSILLAVPLLALILELTGSDDAITGLLCASVGLATLLPTAGTHRRMVSRDKMDECERDWHAQASSKAYPAYGILIMAVLMTYGLAEWFLGAPALTGRQLTHLSLAFGIYLVALPMAYAAWFMPAPVTGEDDEA